MTEKRTNGTRLSRRAEAANRRCCVECSVCEHRGGIYPARFHRQHLPQGSRAAGISRTDNHLLFLLEGELCIRTGDGDVRLRPEQGFLLPRGEAPEIRATADAEVVRLDFSNRILLGKRDWLDSLAATERPRKAETAFDRVLVLDGRLTGILETLQTIDSPCWHLCKQYELFLNMAAGYPKDKLARFFRPILNADEDFRAFVENNFSMKDTLEIIARKANMSSSYFTRRFHEAFRETAYQWQTERKHRELTRLIAGGQTDTEQLAKALGFKTRIGFVLFVRKTLGCTPETLIEHRASGR